MLVEYKGAYYESLSLAMVRNLLLGNPSITPGYADDSASSRHMRGWSGWNCQRSVAVRVPVDESAATLIPYRGYQGSFRYLLDCRCAATGCRSMRSRASIAVVGTTAPGLMDLRATPVGATPIPGWRYTPT
jgi:adenylate cyclase